MQILVLSGFLGSGKTSLLMRLAEYLTKEAQKGERLTGVILENESGADGGACRASTEDSVRYMAVCEAGRNADVQYLYDSQGGE